MIENTQVQSFEISGGDMERMDDLDEYLVTDWLVIMLLVCILKIGTPG